MIDKKRSGRLIAALLVLAAAAIFIWLRGTAGSMAVPARAQAPEPRPNPVVVGQPMPDFTLPVYQGGTLTLSSLRGKNVLLLFPRGYAAENYWCTICNYKYAELAELEKTRRIREAYNLEILVVFPYGHETVTAWLKDLPGQLESIQNVKNPAEPDKLDDAARRRMEGWRKMFPADYSLKEGEVLAPFPVLVDGERTLSRGLGLFQTEWGGRKVDQNIPSIYIVDDEGVLQFKYLGQNTMDRPGYDYLLRVLEVINSRK
jgi:peroxiredoxin